MNKKALKDYCHQPSNSIVTDESYEQLYSSNEFDLFKEMMRRKNLILQLQAMVHLQMECGVMKPTGSEDDRILQLLVSATKPNVKTKSSTIDSVPEELLREKLQELTVKTDEASPNVLSREEFLKRQRDLIIEKQRDERVRALEKETKNDRPRSAVQIAKKSMMDTKPTELTEDELEKRRIIAAKLRREVVDKR